MSTPASERRPGLDDIDRAIVQATQAGLPLSITPFRTLAEKLRIPEEALMARLERMLETGAIRRIAAVPQHYALGIRANGMSVWDVDDDRIDELGERVGALAFVSHCYRRPRRLPDWPYNLFAMVHGCSRDEVIEQVAEIEHLLGPARRVHDILFSSGVLKKTGLRLSN